MADYTINTGSNPYHGRSRKGASTPSIEYFQESTAASTAVIKLGDIVSRDTTVTTGGFRIRRAYAGGGDGANLLAIAQHIVGVAIEGSTSDGSATGLSSGTGGTPLTRKIGVAVADGDTEFVGYLIGDTSAAVSRSSLVGLQRSVRYDSTNHIFGIDSTNSTVALRTIVLTGIPEGTEDSTNGPMYFKFLSSNVDEAVA